MEPIRLIPLTGIRGRGQYAIIDDDDYDTISPYAWYLSGHTGETYVVTHLLGRLHRVLLGTDAPMVDHWNGNHLDNRKINLRPCASSQNQHNGRRPRGLRTSKFKGVHLHAANQKWIAQIMIEKEKVYLGSFNTQEQAAQAYDQKALDVFGKFALLNFPITPPPSIPKIIYPTDFDEALQVYLSTATASRLGPNPKYD